MMAPCSSRWRLRSWTSSFYAGDGASLTVTTRDANNAVVNVTGTYKAQIRATKSAADPPAATFTIDSTGAASGVLVLKLTGVQTLALVTGLGDDGFRGFWDCQWTAAGAEPLTLVAGMVICDTDVSR